MKLIYLGADVPSNRVILESVGVQHVGVSFWRLTKRGLPKNKTYLLSNYFNPYTKIHVHPGIPDNAQISLGDLNEFAVEYETFLANNMDRITSFLEIDHPIYTKAAINAQRDAAWGEEPKFWATIRSDHSYAEIVEMCQKYKNVAIPYNVIEADVSLAAKTRALTTQYGTTFHALACAKPDNLRQIQVATASTQSWLSPMMRGETIVWDGTKLVRYPKKMKDPAPTSQRSKNSYFRESAAKSTISGPTSQNKSFWDLWAKGALAEAPATADHKGCRAPAVFGMRLSIVWGHASHGAHRARVAQQLARQQPPPTRAGLPHAHRGVLGAAARHEPVAATPRQV